MKINFLLEKKGSSLPCYIFQHNWPILTFLNFLTIRSDHLYPGTCTWFFPKEKKPAPGLVPADFLPDGSEDSHLMRAQFDGRFADSSERRGAALELNLCPQKILTIFGPQGEFSFLPSVSHPCPQTLMFLVRTVINLTVMKNVLFCVLTKVAKEPKLALSLRNWQN